MTRLDRLAVILFCAATGSLHAQAGTLAVGDARISYEVKGQGRAVVFIHGWALNLTAWDDQVRAFAPGYRAVRYDRRGFGKSTGFPDQTADPADLATLLDTLGIQSATLIGHSQGGEVALAFAVAFPGRVDALVLYGAGPPVGFGVPFDGPDAFPDMVAIARQHGPDSVANLLWAHPLAWVPPGRSDVLDRYRTFWATYSKRDLLEDHQPSMKVPPAQMSHLRALTVPTLVVIGDRELPYIRLVADMYAYSLPNARKTVIANAGHGAHFVQPRLFNAALRKFLVATGSAAARAAR
jgi:pimeloyl-ACP methyl ester carboxylesterase